MLQLFTTNVMKHLKCNNVYATNVKTIIVSPDSKLENFLRDLWHRQDYFTHFEQSRTSGWDRIEISQVRFSGLQSL